MVEETLHPSHPLLKIAWILLFRTTVIDSPEKIELVGDFLALRWTEGKEVFLDSSTLRTNSPSAEQSGETDIFGRSSGGSSQNNFQEVKINSFEKVGNYALRLIFSDGHSSGIYSWDYFLSLSPQE
jgi:DUF971 family protein